MNFKNLSMLVLAIVAVVGCNKKPAAPAIDLAKQTPMTFSRLNFDEKDGFTLEDADEASASPQIRSAIQTRSKKKKNPSNQPPKPTVFTLIEKALADVGYSPQQIITAVGMGSLTNSGSNQCLYVHMTWRDVNSGAVMNRVYMPEEQDSDCEENFIPAGSTEGWAGGYFISLAKILEGTYAGAAGAGILGVTPLSIAGCGVAVAGIASLEYGYVAGVGVPLYCAGASIESPIPLPLL